MVGWGGIWWDGVGYGGMGWDMVGWGGIWRDGVGYGGMGWDMAGWGGIWRDGVGYGGMGWDMAGWGGIWWDGVGYGGMGWDMAGWGGIWRDGVGYGGMGWDIGMGGCLTYQVGACEILLQTHFIKLLFVLLVRCLLVLKSCRQEGGKEGGSRLEVGGRRGDEWGGEGRGGEKKVGSNMTRNSENKLRHLLTLTAFLSSVLSAASSDCPAPS